MTEDKILEIADKYDTGDIYGPAATWNFITEDLIAFAEAVIDTERRKYQELIEKAEAVIERWGTPNWKEAKPTAEALYKLRDAVERVKEEEE